MAKIVFKNIIGNSERQMLKSHDDALAEKDKRSLILWQNKLVCQSAFGDQNSFKDHKGLMSSFIVDSFVE